MNYIVEGVMEPGLLDRGVSPLLVSFLGVHGELLVLGWPLVCWVGFGILGALWCC